MTYPEIRMLQQSDVFVRRLFEAARRPRDSAYHLHRRVNWSHRHHGRFYQDEARLFTSDVEAYVAGKLPLPPQIDDVFAQRLSSKAVAVALAKVSAHWLFRLLGMFQRSVPGGSSIYRKAYVDDIELVFDTNQPCVLRAVYPFPVSVRRQWRYIGTLSKRAVPWMATGNPYALADVMRLVLRRDLRSLQRMESRAQIRSAFSIATRGFGAVQVSDEFDLGSLDFARALARRGVRVVNSAHGAGKYLPVHAYSEFHVLTGRQQAYYIAARPCRYVKRTLNENAPIVGAGKEANVAVDDSKIDFVLIGGTTSYAVGEDYLARNEAEACRRIGQSLGADPRIRLLYRPHPNHHAPVAPEGFELLTGLGAVNGRSGTVFGSYSSTCQIDPAFKGRKILIRGEYMFPETWFDSTEEMMDLDELIAALREQAQLQASRRHSTYASAAST